MTKNNKPTTQPEQIIADVQDMPAETAENVVSMADKNRRNRLNALEVIASRQTEAVRNKVELLHEAEEAIENVVSIAGNAESNAETESRIAEASSKVGDILFRGRVQGILSPDEVTELLGKGFGYKTKQNGDQSKTPFGNGEAIRKRVVRAVDAWSFVTGGDAKAFFEPLEVADVKPLVTEVLNGKRTVNTLYKDLADMKQAAASERLPAAFNPKNILKMASALTENVGASVERWHDTPGLFEAYIGFYRAITLISEEYGDKYADEIKAA
jgi:hypothetical protein